MSLSTSVRESAEHGVRAPSQAAISRSRVAPATPVETGVAGLIDGIDVRTCAAGPLPRTDGQRRNADARAGSRHGDAHSGCVPVRFAELLSPLAGFLRMRGVRGGCR